MTVCAFSDPALLDQLFGNYGDSASLQAGMSREVGSRDRLVRADQIENDPPVDIACGFAGSDLKIGQIDSSHRCEPRRLQGSFALSSLIVQLVAI